MKLENTHRQYNNCSLLRIMHYNCCKVVDCLKDVRFVGFS